MKNPGKATSFGRRMPARRAIARRAIARAALLVALALPTTANADQPSDWMIGAPEEGTFLNLDFVVGALQSTVEHRIPVYGAANMFTLRGGGMVALPFTAGQADIEMRVLNLTLGVSGGGANVYRNMTFETEQPLHRKERRERDAAGEFNSESYGYFESRAGLAFLFNDYLVFNNVNAWRISGAPERSFDYLTNIVHDGSYVRSDFQLFVKHRDYGGVAPMVQMLNFPLDDEWRTQFNFGFFAATRAGLTGRDDLLALQMLFHVHDVFGGYDNEDVYGWALLRGPISFLFVYRSQIGLWNPS